MMWGIVESRTLVRSKRRSLHIAPGGLALLEHRHAFEVGRVLDVTPIESVAHVRTMGFGSHMELEIMFDDGRLPWRLEHIPSDQAGEALQLITAYVESANKRKEPAFTGPLVPTSMAQEAQELLRGGARGVPDTLDFFLVQAIHHGASDVHFDPLTAGLKVSLRIDGMLHEVTRLPIQWHAKFLNRTKVVAGLLLHRHNVPQEGHITVSVGNRSVDARVTIMPTVYGEKVSVRLLDPQRTPLHLEELGMNSQTLSEFAELLTRPEGMILLTGPSNSGKTTTMYASLIRIHEQRGGRVSIATVEEPVERNLGLFNQTRVDPQAGVTYGVALRTILRQDPDVLMVGEVRDLETAEIVVRAGLTGHLVLSTVHAKSGVAVFLRLIEIGVEPFLVASCVTAVVSQRLVRTVCSNCKQAYEPERMVLERVGCAESNTESARCETVPYYVRGKGCPHCFETGYRGRTGIFELLKVTEPIRDLILNRAPAHEIEREAIRSGMKTLREDGVEKIQAGLTTPEELARVLGEEGVG